jgi:hypothetical protein
LRNTRGISQEQVLVTDSSEILEKFSGIGPQFKRFLRNQSFENYFREIPEIFSGIFPKKFLRNFLDYLSGNS